MNVMEETNDYKILEAGHDLSYINTEVVKTENIKNEVTDIDSSSTIRVNCGMEYDEQMTFRCEFPVNEGSLEAIKHEGDVIEDQIAHDTGLSIKTELSDEVGEYDLSHEQFEFVKLEGYELDCGNEYMEHTTARCYVSADSSDLYQKQYINDMGSIKIEQNVEKESHGGNIKKYQQCRRQHNKKTNWYEYQLNDIEVKTKRRSMLHVALQNDDAHKIFHCAVCDFKTKFKQSLLLHYRLKHDDSAEIFHCGLCDFKTKCKRDLWRHHKIKHDDSPEFFHCKLCDFKTKLKRYLQQHYRRKHDEAVEIFHCELCDYKTKLKDSLLRHHKSKHDDSAEIFHCQLCDLKTKSKQNLVRHHRLKHDNSAEILHCKLCDYETKLKKYLLDHYKRKHDETAEIFHCERQLVATPQNKT